MQSHRNAGLVAGLVVLGLVAAPHAVAAPVTVDLRIEGADRTLFEDPVTVDVRSFRFTGEAAEHRCDGTADENQGPSPTPVATRGAAVAEAAERTPFTIRGQWFDSFGSPSFSEIAGDDVGFDPGTNRFLAEYENGEFASFGSCGDPVQAGDDVLFAYADGSERLLALSGPQSARPGQAVSVTVTDASTGTPVEGAAVGDRFTGADGTAVVGPFSQRGANDLKATKPGTIRSNRLRVCVTDGADGACGTTAPGGDPVPATTPARDLAPPVTRIGGIREGQRFARSRGPRTLRGTVAPDPSGLRAVKLSLTRSRGGSCSWWSSTRERFRGTRCGRRAYFRIGDRQDWSYLLPRRLGPGRYVLDAVAIDKAGNREPLARGRNRVVFFVGPAPASRATATATAASVRAMVVGRTSVLRGTRSVRLRARRVRVGGRRCTVGAATPLGVLAGMGLALRVRDYGSCGRSAADAGGLYVVRVGADGERGTGGWVYKVGRRTGTGAAAEPTGSFGTGRRLRAGARVLWFWCRAAGNCQRTLEAVPASRGVAAGEPLRVTVRGYDDQGRGVPVPGATVRLGSARAVSGPDGTATVVAPARRGTARLSATIDGMVRSFTEAVTVR